MQDAELHDPTTRCFICGKLMKPGSNVVFDEAAQAPRHDLCDDPVFQIEEDDAP